MQVDKGAIKPILNGSHIMCRGLTSPNAKMIECGQGKIILVMAEGKEHAICVGRTTMSSYEMKNINQGVGIEVIHHLGDSLWQLTSIDAYGQ